MDVEEGNQHPVGLPAPGSLVGGKYRLERYIAEGGMGVIAVAHHVELDEPIALKFLKPDVVGSDASGTVASRFMREARSTIKIRSEHVPRIFDVTTLASGVPYIVMELLRGEDLDRRVERDGPLPAHLAVDLILQSLEALAAAHALGMVHRDFKPANLFVGTRLDGTLGLKVLDFGIAKIADASGGRDHGLTQTSTVMGSPRYMAPEQMRATRDVDARADIWAVGTTLYELLAGVPPFDGQSLTEVCAAILQDHPLPMSRRSIGVPPALEAVILRCLAKRPDDRYPNVAELAAALAPFGTAPAAYELASRAARVLGAPAPTSVFLPPAAPVALPSVASQARETMPDVSASATGMTHASWTGIPPGPMRRRQVWTLASLASVAAFLLVSGSVLGVVALRYRAAHGNGVVTASSATLPANAPPAAAPLPVLPDPAPLASVPVATTTATMATTTATAPSAKSSSQSAEPKAKPGAAKPSTTAAVANKPARGTATAVGLWDDRK